MIEWLRAPVSIDRGNLLVIIGMVAATIVALPIAVRARDERRIRAFEFASRVQGRAASADSAAGA